MFRLLAVFLILYGSVGFSYKLCQEMRLRMRHVEQMKEIFRMVESEISYSRAALPEACLTVSKRVIEPYKSAMEEVYAETQRRSGMLFPAIWQEKMGQCLKEMPVKKQEQEIFLGFGNQTGFIDWEMQVGMIEKNRSQLEELYLQLKGAMENKEKVITSVGVLGGLMLVIVLI